MPNTPDGSTHNVYRVNVLPSSNQTYFRHHHLSSFLDEQSHAIMKRLEQLESLNKELIERSQQEGLMHDTMVDQLHLQDNRMSELVSSISTHEKYTETLLKQLQTQDQMYSDIIQKLELQEVFHQTVMERFNHQEALTEKVFRQLDMLRATIYERSAFIIEKITKPVQHLFLNPKKKSESK